MPARWKGYISLPSGTGTMISDVAARLASLASTRAAVDIVSRHSVTCHFPLSSLPHENPRSLSATLSARHASQNAGVADALDTSRSPREVITMRDLDQERPKSVCVFMISPQFLQFARSQSSQIICAPLVNRPFLDPGQEQAAHSHGLFQVALVMISPRWAFPFFRKVTRFGSFLISFSIAIPLRFPFQFPGKNLARNRHLCL